MCARMNRIAAVNAHLSPWTQAIPAAAARAAAGASTAGAEGKVTLLTEAQVKDYIVNGYLVLTPEELPGGQEAFADSFYTKVKGISGPEVHLVGNVS
jgi:hypothetical protein